MSTLIARRLAKRASWLPHGAQDYLDLRAGLYWTGRKSRRSLAEAFTAAGFTFARASQAGRYDATGRLVYDGADIARLDTHPVTHAPLGLLLERAMTQLAPTPEALDTWTKQSGLLVDTNTDDAPDGAHTADGFRPPNATSNSFALRKTVTVVAGGRYSASLFMKHGAGAAAGVHFVRLAFNHSALFYSGWFDLQNGAPGGTANSALRYMRSAGAGYYRLGISSVTAGVTSTVIDIGPAASDGNVGNYTGDGVAYNPIWGAQVEQGDFPTSYNAGNNRAADSLTRAIAQPGHFCRVIGFTAPIGLSTNVVWQMDDGTQSNRIRLVRDNAGAIRLVVTNGGSETANLNLGPAAAESFNRVAVQFDGTTFKAVLNASPTLQQAIAAMPTATLERIGSGAVAGEEFCGWIAEYATYGSLADGGLLEASRVFPSWVPTDSTNTPADLFLDRVNGRYWYGGAVYPTLSAFKTAIGATSYGDDDWTIPWTASAFTVVREGLAGNSVAAGHAYTHVQADAGSTSLSKLEQGTGLNSIYGQTYFGAFQFYTDTFAMRKFETARHAVTFKSNAFGIAYNGGNLQTVSTGTVPAVTTLRIGNNVARNAPSDDGELWKLAIFRTPRAAAELAALSSPPFAAIAAGDSFMDGSLDAGVPMSFARLVRRTIFNRGVGGSTLASQVPIATAMIAAWPNAIFLHWDGKSNGYDPNIAVDKANYETMVAALGHGRFIIFCPLTSSGDIAANPVQTQRQRDLTTWLKGRWPSNVIDTLPYLKTLGNGSVQDNADIAADAVPTSLMWADQVHLKQSTHDAIHNNLTMPLITARGWLRAE